MAGHRLLAIGFYGKNNLGDELFREAIEALWPEHQWTFTDEIPGQQDFDAVIFGPGDLLYDPPKGAALHPRLPVGFLGVGADLSRLGPWLPLLQRARFIVTRDRRLRETDLGAILLPDIGFSLRPYAEQCMRDRAHVAVLLNENLTGATDQPEWKVRGGEWFAHEMAGALDELRRRGYGVGFWPMQVSPRTDDRLAAAAVLSRMQCRGAGIDYETRVFSRSAFQFAIAQSSLVFTARLHGAIFCTQTGTPFVPLIAHDKMRHFCDELSYAPAGRAEFYGARKAELLSAFDTALRTDSDALIKFSRQAYDTWHNFAGTLMDKFFG